MNTRRKLRGEIGGDATWVIQVSPYAQDAGIEMPVHSGWLTDR